MRKHLIVIVFMFCAAIAANAQVPDTTNHYGAKKPDPENKFIADPKADVQQAAPAESKEIEKTGFSFGPCPIVAFDQDKGFQYGALCNIYDFGKGGWYPNPRQQLYLEASLFAKNGNFANSQLFTINYDNRFLIPGVRFTFTAQLTNEKALDFFGFNGYESYYDSSLPTAYYKYSRLVPYGKLDFSGHITEHLYWKAGYHFKYFKIESFTSDALADLPNQFTLFDWYKFYDVIPEGDETGGFTSSIRAGLMFDSRDVEASPSRGIWADANIEYAPTWMGTTNSYAKYYFCFRNYLPLASDKLVFAYRANVQGFLGQAPFYVLSYDSYLGQTYDKDGFGGYRTIRGIMRNRIQGKSVFYYNTELRWRFIDFRVGKQNIALALSGFFDGGRVIERYIPWHDNDVFHNVFTQFKSKLPAQEGIMYTNQLASGSLEDSFHFAAGGGFRFIMNKNFIIAVEYGMPFNKQDNSKGSLYINTGFLF